MIKLNGALGTKMGFSGHFDGLSKKNGALVVLLMFSRHQMPMFLLFYSYLCNCRSATEVCNGLSYLDLIINQIEVGFWFFFLHTIFQIYIGFVKTIGCLQSLNSKHGCNVPLILMNTIRTHDGTLKVTDFPIHILSS